LKKTFLIFPGTLLLITALFFSGITIPLDSFDRRLESLLAKVLERNVTVQGPVTVKLGLQPVLEFEGLTIADPADWSDAKNFIVVKKAKGQLALLPLLQGNIHINDLELEGVNLRLITKADQSNNFQFGSSSENTGSSQSDHELTGLDSLRLNNIHLSYLDEHSGKEYKLFIDEAHGQGMKKSQLQLSLKGKLFENPCSLEITGGSLYALLYGKQAWPLSNGKLRVKDAALDVSGTLIRTQDGMTEYLHLSVLGPNLDVITSLFDVELPETGKFDISGQLSVLPGAFRLLNLQLNVQDSALQGDLLLSLESKRSFLQGVLAAPYIDQSLFSIFNKNPSEMDTLQKKNEKNSSQLPWDILKTIDLDLQFSITAMDYGDYHFKNIKTVASLIDGDLIAPFSLLAMDTAVTGRADIFSSPQKPSVTVTAHSENVELSPLIESLSKNRSISAAIGSLSLLAKSYGKTLDELTENFDLDFTADEIKIQADTDTTIASDRISLQRRAGQSMVLSGKGKALGSPFSLLLKAGTAFEKQKNDSLPINLQLNACETDLLLETSLQKDLSIRFDYTVSGEKLCGILEPVSLMLGKETGFSSEGNGGYSAGAWSVNLESFKLDSYLFDAKIVQILTPAGTPLITATAHSSELNLQSYLSHIQQNKTTPDNPKEQPLPDQNSNRKKDT